jgi:tetratricopeptide (TPR) repeat protein
VRSLLLGLLAISLVLAGCNFGKSKTQLATEAVQRGLQAHREGRLDEAANAYHEALDNDPRNKYALYNLGLIDQQAGRPRSAEAYYQLALEIDPDLTSARFNLALLRASAGAPQEAIEHYRRVIAQQPGDARAHLNLGYTLRSVGQEAEGVAEIRRAADLDSSLRSHVERLSEAPTPSRSPTP